MARRVEHEITLVAFMCNDDGTRSIVDVVETSNHYASKFMRGWLRANEVNAVGTIRPNGSIADMEVRNIK